MSLNDVKINTDCIIKEVKIKDERFKIRLMELGLIEDAVIQVNKKSLLKKTLLININSTLFTLKDNIAKEIVVNYA